MKGCERVSTLDNLTAKILADSEAKAAEILAGAKAEAERIQAAAVEEANREKEKILSEAKVAAAREEEQIVVGGTLAVRDQNLAAKQQMLDKVFAEALSRLNAMGKDEYLKFLTGCLSKLDLDGEEILLPEKYGIGSADEINAALKKAGKKGNLTLSRPGRKIEGGFVLSKGGIEQNNTFEALVGYYRYELESEVISTLY